MAKIVKKISFDLDLDSHKTIQKIIKSTGESKVNLLKRLMSAELERINRGPSVSQSTESAIDQFKSAIEELKSTLEKISKNTGSIRDGENKVYCSVLNLIKDQFRLNSFIVSAFSQMSLLQPKQISIIKEDSDKNASEYFNMFFNMINSATPVEIVENLKKN
jgi:hypothetical protein